MSVLDVKVKSGEHPKFYKSGISSLEKRINQLEHQAFCCLPADIAAAEEEKVVSFTLTALADGSGNWQVMPAGGHVVLPAPGAGKQYIVTNMIARITVTVDITGGGAATIGNFVAQTGTGILTEPLATPAGAVAARLGQAPPAVSFGAGSNETLNIDHGAGTVADAAAVGTAEVQIYYKIVSI